MSDGLADRYDPYRRKLTMLADRGYGTSNAG